MTIEESYEVVKYLSFCEDVSPHHKNALSMLLCAYDRQKEAWEKVKEEIKEKINDLDERTRYTEMENGKWCGLELAKKIIDKHLQEVENDK